MSTLLLAIESGGERVGAALFAWTPGEPGRLLAGRSEGAHQDHGRRLLPLIVALFGEIGATATELGAVAVGRGPGSYTGLRVGIATALGLAAAGPARVFGVESLRAAAWQADDGIGGAVAVLAEAGRGGIYAQTFRWAGAPSLPEALGDPLRLAPGEVASFLGAAARDEGGPLALIAVGEAAAEAAKAAAGFGATVRSVPYLDPAAIGGLAMTLVGEGVSRHEQALAVAPIYLRPAAAAPGA